MLNLKYLCSLRTERNLVVIALLFFIEVSFSVCLNCSVVFSTREKLKYLCIIEEICKTWVLLFCNYFLCHLPLNLLISGN